MSLGISVGTPKDYGMDEDLYWRTKNIFDAQSIAFTCEILPFIWSLYPEGEHVLELLDIGSRTGAGTGLIAYIHQQYAFNRIKVKATALDIDGNYQLYAQNHYPLVRYMVGDIFNMSFENLFDIVIASHTIEHVSDPVKFIKRLQELSSGHVIVACPFEEKNLIDGHIHSFNEQFFKDTEALRLEVYTSTAWAQSKACIAIYAGHNKSADNTQSSMKVNKR